MTLTIDEIHAIREETDKTTANMTFEEESAWRKREIAGIMAQFDAMPSRKRTNKVHLSRGS